MIEPDHIVQDIKLDLQSLLSGIAPYKLFVGQYGIDQRKEWGVIALEDIA